jgi:hypothetical protein
MKKLLILLVSSLAFGLSLEDRVSQLEKEVKLLKEQISKINSSQKELKTFKNNVQKEIQKGVLLTCQNLKLTDFKYRYNDGFYKTYDLFYTIKNNYKKEIKFIKAYITIKDKEDDTLIEDFIKRDVSLKPNKTVTIKTNYTIDFEAGLSQYLKTTPLKNLDLIFKPSVIIFKDNTKIKCQN